MVSTVQVEPVAWGFYCTHACLTGPSNCNLFFISDCNWGDHVGDVAQTFGVLGQRTPRGLQWDEFQQALANYKQRQIQSTERVLRMVR